MKYTVIAFVILLSFFCRSENQDEIVLEIDSSKIEDVELRVSALFVKAN